MCFYDIVQVIELVRSFGVEPRVEVWGPDTPLSHQVRVMAETGVLLSAHGAGLMNEIFLPPGARCAATKRAASVPLFQLIRCFKLFALVILLNSAVTVLPAFLRVATVCVVALLCKLW